MLVRLPTSRDPQLPYQGTLGIMVVVVSDVLGAMIMGVSTVVIVTDVIELVPVWFLHWQFIFKVFFEIHSCGVYGYQKCKCSVQHLQMKGLRGQSSETEGETVIYKVLTECRGLN